MDARIAESLVVRNLRRLLLLVLAIGLVGTASDLLLIEHYEDAWQLPPLVLIAAALGVVVWLAARSDRAGWRAVLALRLVMVLFIGAGVFGVLLHYNGNREFQLELDPSLGGWPLFVKVMTAKAPPALAPGSMVQLGLIGLIYTYRHPVLRAESGVPQPTSSGA